MNQQNMDLLEEVYKAGSMGKQAAELLLPKVQDPRMRTQLQRQRDNYEGMAGKARQMLGNAGHGAGKGTSPMQKAMLWGNVQMSTLTDSSTSHIAQMLVQGCSMGIVDVRKRLNELPQADSDARKLAEEFVQGEQHSIENLKALL